jgi:hypothetical protein
MDEYKVSCMFRRQIRMSFKNALKIVLTFIGVREVMQIELI